ncbi:AMP-binding protein [Argonema antarcticum]|uniref:AMP-binding protein n=1 Tax=Argonema antarcticum TaxID=2942763 RepID=UPI0020123CA4|nr:AMP-binding protein [Argonema antarcticum]MCL1470397.1 AMP-binding protein [Argonema antarcticum A004/B2]
MNIATILHDRTATHPQLPAIIDTDCHHSRIITFADLELAASRVCTLLRRCGLQPGDAVLVFYPMSAELYTALLALFRLGLVAIFLDPGAGRKHINQCCKLYPPKALIASHKAHLLRLVSPALRRIPLKFAIAFPVPGAISWHSARHLPPDPEIVRCSHDTPALLTFTSGSTGQPKAALRTHGFLLSQNRVLAQCLQPKPGEVELVTLPIFVLANLAAGMTSVIPKGDLRFPGAIAPSPIIAQIQTHKPSRILASPAFLERLAEYCLKRRLTLPSIEKIFSGGATVMPLAIAKWQQIAPQAEFTVVYGSTEAEPIARICDRDIKSEDITATLNGRGLLVGKPVSAIQLKIIRQQWGKPIISYTESEFANACLPPETVGEIVVSGNHVLPGYLYGYGNEETKFNVEGIPWHRTGDGGYLDLQGRLWLLGRCSAYIEDEYGILYPFAVEAVVQHYPNIRRCAIVSYRGRRILVVELNNPKSKINLTSLHQSLANTQIHAIKVCKKLPVDKRHNSKIDYPALLKLLQISR